MDEEKFDALEGRLQSLAEGCQYPPTPDVRAGFRRGVFGGGSQITPASCWAWAALGVLVALVVLTISVPPVRATVAEIVEQGAVRILLGGGESQGDGLDAEVSSSARADLGGSSLAGETSLGAVRSTVPFPVSQPAYPPDLGPPDHVYLQNSDGWIVIQLWEDQGLGSGLALYLVERGAFITKEDPPVLRRVSVDGEAAIWTEGAHFLQVERGGFESRRLVEGHVLIWTRGEVTYRLESDLPLDEAVLVAESLH
jgi:hypothetical protein